MLTFTSFMLWCIVLYVNINFYYLPCDGTIVLSGNTQFTVFSLVKDVSEMGDRIHTNFDTQRHNEPGCVMRIPFWRTPPRARDT